MLNLIARVCMLSVLLLSAPVLCVPNNVPTGTFRTECWDRHFWLAVKSSFLGPVFRFDVEGRSGTRSISGQSAGECGYTTLIDPSGDFILRASYLACDVDSQDNTGLQLLVLFVNKESNGTETLYPFLLTCPPQHWSPREIICERNYMEVSVKMPTPPLAQKGLEWMTPPPMGTEQGGLREMRVVFHIPVGHQKGPSLNVREEKLSLKEVRQLGYHVNATGMRMVLRCSYSSPFSYIIQEKDVMVEVISATVFYQHQWTLLMVDASLACSLYKGTMDGSHVLWHFPQVLSPLVQVPFKDRGVGLGVDGHLLSDCVIQQRRYQIRVQDGIVEVRIPFGAEGGFIKSHMLDGQYSQSYSIELLYLHQWEDVQWTLTQHRSFLSLLNAPIPQSLKVINFTVPAEQVFSLSLGDFAPDVSLLGVAVAERAVSMPEAEQLGLRIAHVPHPNGTHAYMVHVPFAHPLIHQKYIGNGYRRYTLHVNFTLLISPHAEVFSYPATLLSEQQDVVLPRIEAQCTDTGMKMTLHSGNMDAQWGIYFGNHRLGKELVEVGGYRVEPRHGYLAVEVPLYGLGMDYEELHLQGLLAKVVVSVVDMDTGAVEHISVQRCMFPVNELMVCLPDGQLVVMVDTAGFSPLINPSHTSLLDPACGPKETDRTRALFSFRLDSCGTVMTMEDDDLVFLNEVRYSPKYLPPQSHFIHPFHYYRQPIGCRYPRNFTRTMSVYQSQAVAPFPHQTWPHRSKRERSQGYSLTGGKVSCPPWCDLWR